MHTYVHTYTNTHTRTHIRLPQNQVNASASPLIDRVCMLTNNAYPLRSGSEVILPPPLHPLPPSSPHSRRPSLLPHFQSNSVRKGFLFPSLHAFLLLSLPPNILWSSPLPPSHFQSNTIMIGFFFPSLLSFCLFSLPPNSLCSDSYLISPLPLPPLPSPFKAQHLREVILIPLLLSLQSTSNPSGKTIPSATPSRWWGDSTPFPTFSSPLSHFFSFFPFPFPSTLNHPILKLLLGFPFQALSPHQVPIAFTLRWHFFLYIMYFLHLFPFSSYTSTFTSAHTVQSTFVPLK